MTETADILSAPTLVDLLRARARRDPARLAYTFLNDGEIVGASLTYGELDQRARAIGAAVQAAGARGERVLLLFPPGLDFVAAFFGCLYGGGVGIPAPASDAHQLRRTLPRLKAIAGDAEPALILTTGENVAVIREMLPDLFGDSEAARRTELLATDALGANGTDGAERWEDPRLAPDDLAFLQYTSGSTADPKGVMISHANLLYTSKDIDASWHYDESSVVVSWLPIFHDMGLICGVVMPVYRGCQCVLMSPVAFVQKPLRWLRAIDDFGGTHSAAPNFAYDLAVRKVGAEERAQLDLSRWVVSLSSAEPVRKDTMERFHAAFQACGFRWEVFCPGFGLAESTVKVTASERGKAPVLLPVDAQALEEHRVEVLDADGAAEAERASGRRSVFWAVGNGRAILDTQLHIVDPERRAKLGPDRVGEIWVRSPSVAGGYWKRPEATEETFAGYLEDGTGPFMRTGDLGFVDADGELFHAARIKDLLIIRGRNVYPQDVEQLAEQSHPSFRPGCSAAFSVAVDGEERLVLFLEVDPRRGGDLREALDAVRRAVAEAFDLQVFAVVLVGPRQVPKTSSGKVQRRLCRNQLAGLKVPALAASVQRLDASRTGGGRPDWVSKPVNTARLLHALGSLVAGDLDAFDLSSPEYDRELHSLGLDFDGARSWTRRLEQAFDVTLGVELFLDPKLTLQTLTERLADALAAAMESESRAQAETTAAEPPSQRPASPSAPSKRGRGREREVEAWLKSELAKLLGLRAEEIDVRQHFAHHGLDSMQAVDLATELEAWLGRSISSTLVWDYPTIEEAARYLAAPGSQVRVEPTRETQEARSTREPIAIVGMGCRFPGAHGPEEFWELLREGRDAVREVPAERWSADQLYHAEPGVPGKTATRWGGFIDEVDRFDSEFFGISHREAARMDPQQRLLLETTWEALEHAGVSPDALRGSATGVYVGVGSNDYHRIQLSRPEAIDAFAATGNAYSVAANRISYALDLRGPSLAIDTACSSSLVALHQAVRSLRSGECDAALAGGVNLMLSPEWTIAFSHAQMMASDGRCKTFDASADGYVRGEGCGIVVLKRLSDALRDRDEVWAVVRGSALNQDGHSNGITAPNGVSQRRVIRAALADAGVEPSDIGYVEAHGTGTPLGDPIEVQALGEVLAEGRGAESPCVVASVKTNIGHLEAAAGVASLIKTALVLKHGEIPPHLHFSKPNPHIRLESMPVSIPTERRPWPLGGAARVAGVSSFGFGGTNAHIVLSEAPGRALPEPPAFGRLERPRHLICLSARTSSDLARSAELHAGHLERNPSESLANVAYTLGAGRARLAHRVSIQAESVGELFDQLGAVARGEQSGTRVDGDEPTVGWLFTGQGSQAPGMAAELYGTQPTFRRAFDRCCEVADKLLEHPLRGVVFDAEAFPECVHRTAYTQPALYALEVSLAEMWRGWLGEPEAVLGHSIGEYAAAYVAGVFSLEDGMRLVCARGRLMGALPEDGAMVALSVPAEELEEPLKAYSGRLSLAAVNGPRSCVVSGERSSVRDFVAGLGDLGKRATELQVSHAFHSPLMDPMLEDFEQVARGVAFRAPRIPLISNTSGAAMERAPDAKYWSRHLREAVDFRGGVETLLALGAEVLLELGPHPVLSALAARTAGAAGREILSLPALRRGRSDWEVTCRSLGELFEAGVNFDAEAWDRDYQRTRVALPRYPFHRDRHWIQLPGEGPRTETRAPRTMTDTNDTNAGGGAPDSLDAVVALFREQTRTLRELAQAMGRGELTPTLEAAWSALGADSRSSGANTPGLTGAAPADAPPEEITPEVVRENVRRLIARVSGTPLERLRDDAQLHADLGFDSLMTVELDRRVRRLFPGVGNAEAMFTESITVERLVGLAIERLKENGSMDLMTAFQRQPQEYSTYAEMIAKDPAETYVGGAFKSETHALHTITCDGALIEARMDVENKYSGTAGFHMTQMAAYSFIVQMMHGWLCYRFGVSKDGLGMPKLRDIHMRWNLLVRTSKDIPGKVTVRSLREENGFWEIETAFELADGGVEGTVAGFIPIPTQPPAESELTPKSYPVLADLIGKDPKSTYTGGTFQAEKQTIRDIHAEGREVTARLDVENQWSGTKHFHLTQMGTYSYIVQLMLGYFCYKHGVKKDQLGMPTLKEFTIHWDEMVTRDRDIEARIEERTCTEESGRYQVEFTFEVGQGNGQGRLIGLIPIPE